MDRNTVYSSISSIYTKYDPENLLRNQIEDEDNSLKEDVKTSVRQVWNKSDSDDFIVRNNAEDLNVDWLCGILDRKIIDIELPDSGRTVDRESVEAYTKSCTDICIEMEAKTEKRKKKNENDFDEPIGKFTYTHINKEADEGLVLMKELSEKIKKIKNDKNIPANNEYNAVFDEGLRAFVGNVRQTEKFMATIKQIHDAQKIQDKASVCVVYNGDLSRGIEHLAERAHITAYTFEQNRGSI